MDPTIEANKDMENQNAKFWIEEGDKIIKDKKEKSEIAEAYFDKAIKYCEKNEGSDKNDDNNLFYWGLALSRLASIKPDEIFEKNLEKFEVASDGINDPDILLLKGVLYFVLKQPDKEVVECLKNSGKSILRILTFLDNEIEEKILETNILNLLLDSKDSRDGKFFNEITKSLTDEEKIKYKEVFIRSVYIISLLHVKYDEEEYVAHYREKDISEKLLFENNFKFRLNAVDYSNDPTEGKTLLDFLYGKNNYKTDEELNTEYEAFTSSFVFDYDNLNMFRLYGKDDNLKNNREGTGLSLVFGESFFDKYADMAIGTPKRKKFSLYRCIYIDPHEKTINPIATIGRKEKYLFYREGINDKLEKYDEEMNKVITTVRKEMGKLKEQIKEKKLDSVIVGQLLINLRYLVKHIAFKEEQECRIVRIHNLHNDKAVIVENNKRMFIEYPPKVSEHLVKIYFGPKAEGFDFFKNLLKKYETELKDGRVIPREIECKKSENPLA